MTTIFCSNETASLERDVELINDIYSIENIWTDNDLKKCVDWITENKFAQVRPNFQVFFYIIYCVYFIYFFFKLQLKN